MNFDGQKIPNLQQVLRLPSSASGGGIVEFQMSGLDFIVKYLSYDAHTKADKWHAIQFCWIAALAIESETNRHVGFPPKSSTLYGFASDLRRESPPARGYQLWLADAHLITVVCEKVQWEGNDY